MGIKVNLIFDDIYYIKSYRIMQFTLSMFCFLIDVNTTSLSSLKGTVEISAVCPSTVRIQIHLDEGLSYHV